jgi:hypothetical protein
VTGSRYTDHARTYRVAPDRRLAWLITVVVTLIVEASSLGIAELTITRMYIDHASVSPVLAYPLVTGLHLAAALSGWRLHRRWNESQPTAIALLLDGPADIRRLALVLSRACWSWWLVSSISGPSSWPWGRTPRSLWRGIRHHEPPFSVAIAASAAFCTTGHGSAL